MKKCPNSAAWYVAPKSEPWLFRWLCDDHKAEVKNSLKNRLNITSIALYEMDCQFEHKMDGFKQ